MVNCDKCGKFIKHNSEFSMASIFAWNGPDYNLFRCEYCTFAFGPVKSNAKTFDGDNSAYESINLIEPNKDQHVKRN